MKTLKQLINNTPQPVIARSKRTSAVVIKVAMNKQKGVDTVVFTVRCRGHTEEEFYDVIIELYPTEIHQDVFQKPSFDNPCWVTCGCPYWHYFCQYAVSKTGSTNFVQFQSSSHADSMKPPLIRNRPQVPYLCKHLYRAAPEVVKQAVDAARRQKDYKFT